MEVIVCTIYKCFLQGAEGRGHSVKIHKNVLYRELRAEVIVYTVYKCSVQGA